MTRTRFAPSPTGLIHLGNARTALFNALLARRDHGAFILRIEDTDRERSRREHEAALMEDLAWLGLVWDEGPDRGGPHAPYRQSQRGERHHALLQALVERRQAYPCFCTPEALEAERREQRTRGLPPRYSGRCARLDPAEAARRVAAGEPHTLRFRVPTGREITWDDLVRGPQRIASATLGDFVLRRTDGGVAFFFANAVDDAEMAVSHVLRGEDHLANTPRQLLILEALELPAPCYGHLPLIVDEDGRPLSKRSGALALAELRERGYLPVAVVNHLARLGHRYPDERLLDLDALARDFDPAAIHRAPARHQPQALDHWQRLAVDALDDRSWWQWAGQGVAERVPEAERAAFLEAVRPNCLFPHEAGEWAEIIYHRPEPSGSEARRALESAGPEFFCAAVAALRAHPDDPKAFLAALKTATGAKGKALFLPLRLALTGRPHGPELGHLLRLLGPRAEERLAAHCHGN